MSTMCVCVCVSLVNMRLFFCRCVCVESTHIDDDDTGWLPGAACRVVCELVVGYRVVVCVMVSSSVGFGEVVVK